jgi:hypothetical protein
VRGEGTKRERVERKQMKRRDFNAEVSNLQYEYPRGYTNTSDGVREIGGGEYDFGINVE